MSHVKLFVLALSISGMTSLMACGGDDDTAPRIVGADAGTSSTSSDAKAASDSTTDAK